MTSATTTDPSDTVRDATSAARVRVEAEARARSLASEPESVLGDPSGSGPLSWARAVARDEVGEHPGDALRALVEQGFGALYVPPERGGAMPALPTLVALGRALARRDPAVALAGGVRAWSLAVWLGGSEAQKEWIASALLEGGTLCFAASERRHGADLVASEVSALGSGGGYLLSGEKWPIGQATRADQVLLLARDRALPEGPGGLSLFVIDRRRLPAGAVVAGAPLRLAGMRGVEVASLSFERAEVGADALLGARGEGLERTLHLFQLTRPMVCSLGLGIADTALRLATSFACARRLRGQPAADLPWVREQLAGAFVDLLVAEALVDATVRCAHVAPAQLVTASLVAKIVAPQLTARVLEASGEVLGARGFLREGYAGGVYQKLVRDHALLSIFDGSTPVCLAALSTQLPILLAGFDASPAATRARSLRLQVRFDAAIALPELGRGRLSLLARADDVIAGVCSPAGPVPAHLREPIDRRLSELRSELGASRRGEHPRAPLHAAQDYANLHALACVALRAVAPGGSSDLDADALATLAARRLLTRARLDAGDAPVRAAFDTLLTRVRAPASLGWQSHALPDSPLSLD